MAGSEKDDPAVVNQFGSSRVAGSEKDDLAVVNQFGSSRVVGSDNEIQGKKEERVTILLLLISLVAAGW